MQGMDHSKMQMPDADEQASEKDAMSDMAHMRGSNPHMTMTAMRPQTPADLQKANEIVAELKSGIEKYRDYHVALNDGFKIFMPKIPQPEYHFTNYTNGFLAAMQFLKRGVRLADTGRYAEIDAEPPARSCARLAADAVEHFLGAWPTVSLSHPVPGSA